MTRSSLLGSWIDAAAATATAESLCDKPLEIVEPAAPARTRHSGVPSPPPSACEPHAAGLDSSLVGQGSDTPPPRLHGRLQALRDRAERNGLVPASPVAECGPSPFAVPLGSLPVRVRALADWMNESFDPQSLFVADDEGQALVEFRGGADLLAAATVLAEAAAKARRHLSGADGAAVVHLTLGPAQVLSLVSAATVLGVWHAGLTMAVPLDEAAALDLARCLQAAAAGA